MAVAIARATGQNTAGDTDEILLRRCACQDRDALEELMRRYRLPLTRSLSALLASQEDVEEALLDIFVRVWQNAPRFHYEARVSTWLYRIALNRAYDMVRARHRRPETETYGNRDHRTVCCDPEHEALQRLMLGERAATLQRALNRLSISDRSLLVFYYYDEMDYGRMQEITRLSYPVLKNRMNRARRRLRKIMEQVEWEQRDWEQVDWEQTEGEQTEGEQTEGERAGSEGLGNSCG